MDEQPDERPLEMPRYLVIDWRTGNTAWLTTPRDVAAHMLGRDLNRYGVYRWVQPSSGDVAALEQQLKALEASDDA